MEEIKDETNPKIDDNVEKLDLEFKLNLNKVTKNVDLSVIDKNKKNTVIDIIPLQQKNLIVKDVSDSIVNYLTSKGKNPDKSKLDLINQIAVNLYLNLTKEMADTKSSKNNSDKVADTNPIPSPINPIISQRADDIMNNGDPIDFILNVHSTIHIGDRGTGFQLLVSIGCQSVLNTEGIHAKLSGSSGKGKTHCSKAMAHLIPPEYKLVSQVSDKALYYKTDLLDGTVIFSDDVNLSENMESVIKQATSNYQTTTNYGTVIDKEYVNLQIPKRLTFWLTSVNDDQSQQLLNRTFSGGVDESPEQDKRVWNFFTSNALMGVYEFDVTEDVEVCREIIRRIKQQLFFVRIPFAKDIEWNTKVDNNRRNMGIFLDMIKSCAVLRFKQRNMEVIDDKNYIDAILQDFAEAKMLYDTRGKNQGSKLNDVEIKVVRFINAKSINGGVGCTIQELVIYTNLSQSHLHTLIHGRKDREESGLLFKVKGLIHNSENEVIEKGRTHRVNRYLLREFNEFELYDSVISIKMTPSVVTHKVKRPEEVNDDGAVVSYQDPILKKDIKPPDPDIHSDPMTKKDIKTPSS